MSYLGSWKIDDYLTFCANTHDPDTGVATDADAVPAYRVYEDETGTPILIGTMTLLDDANTAGFYSEQIQLTVANDFEKGKCYTIYISAAVGGDAGTMHHNFQIEAEVDVNTVSGLHADWADGGRLDLLIDAVCAVTAAVIADAVWDEALGDHDTEDSFGNVVSDLVEESGGTYRLTEAALAQGPPGGAAIAGAITVPLTITDEGSDPVANANVWVTTDQAGTNLVCSGTTDDSGQETFYLDEGTYYVWAEKSGVNFDNPQTKTVA